MKITKSYLKQLIKEELDKLEEFDNAAAPAVQTQPPSKEDLASDVASLNAQVEAANAAIKAGESAKKNLEILKKQLQDAKSKLGGI